MKTLATLALALMVGAGGSAGGAKDVRPAAHNLAAASNNTGIAVRTADRAKAGRSNEAATGAGETATRSGSKAKAKTDERAQARADRDLTEDASARPTAWPGPSVDASEIT
jgi:hypothetical protein